MAVFFEETGIVVKSYHFECLNIEIGLHQNFEWLKSAPTNLLAPNSWVVKDLILYLILHVPFLHGFESYLQSFSQFLADKVCWWLNSWTTVIWRWIKLGSPQNLRYHRSPTKVPENYSRIRDVKIRFGSKWHLAFLDRNGRESVALGDTVAARNGERFLDRRIFAGVVFPWRK